MRGRLLGLLLAAVCVRPSLAVAQTLVAGPASRLLWDQQAATAAEATSFVYRVYRDGATTGTVLANVSCVKPGTLAQCSVPFPPFAAGAHSLRMTAANASAEGPLSVPFAFTYLITPSDPLPLGWIAADLGTPAVAGSTVLSGGVYTIEAGGVDIWDTTDEGHFLYRPVTGDVDVVARVTAVGTADPWSKAGVMLRASLAGEAANAGLFVPATSGILGFQRRRDTGGTTVSTNASGQAPVWVKIERRGSVVTAFYSITGTTWISMGPQTMPFPPTMYVGVAVSSHNPATAITAVVDNVTITPVAPPPPVAMPPATPQNIRVSP